MFGEIPKVESSLLSVEGQDVPLHQIVSSLLLVSLPEERSSHPVESPFTAFWYREQTHHVCWHAIKY